MRDGDTGKGYLLAKQLTKKHAKTFYLASKFLPRDKMYAAYAVYAVCRISDDSVDEEDINRQEKLTEIENKIETAYAGRPADELMSAFKETIDRYGIPGEYFWDLIEGMRMDLKKKRYSDFKQLYQYCYKVAGVVGLIMLRLFGYENQMAEGHAIELGVAMQLTNILRDIKEDYRKGRIYLPVEDMERFGINEDHIRRETVDDRFAAMLKFQIERARDYYRRSDKGLNMITDPSCRFVARAMNRMYAGILCAIEKNKYDVFSRRACMSTAGKLAVILKILFNKDTNED